MSAAAACGGGLGLRAGRAGRRAVRCGAELRPASAAPPPAGAPAPPPAASVDLVADLRFFDPALSRLSNAAPASPPPAPSPAPRSFDLVVDLRFFDPTIVVNTSDIWGAAHPGVRVVPSSGGKKLFTCAPRAAWRWESGGGGGGGGRGPPASALAADRRRGARGWQPRRRAAARRASKPAKLPRAPPPRRPAAALPTPAAAAAAARRYGQGDDTSSWAVTDFQVGRTARPAEVHCTWAALCATAGSICTPAFGAHVPALGAAAHSSAPPTHPRLAPGGALQRGHAGIYRTPTSSPAPLHPQCNTPPQVVPYSVDLGSWFDAFSDVQSDAGDPMPLAPTPEVKEANGCLPGDGRPCNVYA